MIYVYDFALTCYKSTIFYVYMNVGQVDSAFLIMMSTTLFVTVNGNETSIDVASLSNNFVPGFIKRYKFNFV